LDASDDAVETSFENLKFSELTETIINLETVNPIEFLVGLTTAN